MGRRHDSHSAQVCRRLLIMSQLSDVKWFTLGWPLSLDKLRDFCATVRYIGFDWDFELKLVSLPEEKRIVIPHN
jgi:hypothetical protein